MGLQENMALFSQFHSMDDIQNKTADKLRFKKKKKKSK